MVGFADHFAEHCDPYHTSVAQLVIDTDLSIDVDDVGALCLAHALADNCEARILAIVHDTGLPSGAAGVEVFNRYYGRDVPVGAYRGPVGDPAATENPSWTHKGRGVYVDDILANWPSPEGAAVAEAPPALDVLREALISAADGSVTFVSIGFATNLLDLLAAPGGVQLVSRKVKRMVMMGGRARPRSLDPVEWNFGGCGGTCGETSYNALGAITNRSLALWPRSVPISFLGFEAGVLVGTGGFYRYASGSSPCADGYKLFCARMEGWCGRSGRDSWDPMAMLFAVRGDNGRYTREVGNMLVNPLTGGNRWLIQPPSRQNQPAGHPAPQENLILESLSHALDIQLEINDLLRLPPNEAVLPLAVALAALAVCLGLSARSLWQARRDRFGADRSPPRGAGAVAMAYLGGSHLRRRRMVEEEEDSSRGSLHSLVPSLFGTPRSTPPPSLSPPLRLSRNNSQGVEGVEGLEAAGGAGRRAAGGAAGGAASARVLGVRLADEGDGEVEKEAADEEDGESDACDEVAALRSALGGAMAAEEERSAEREVAMLAAAVRERRASLTISPPKRAITD